LKPETEESLCLGFTVRNNIRIRARGCVLFKTARANALHHA
jgi:hypothetical protein